MKRMMFILSILAVLLAESCNTQKTLNDVQVQIPFEENVPYSFEKITEPSVWITFNNLEEMKNACQMPENWLKHISTDDLILTCMDYPLLPNYSAHSNPMNGIKDVVEGFNGLQELSKRTDAAEKLVKFYGSLKVQSFEEASSPGAYKDHNSVLKLGFLELYLASGYIKGLYDGNNYLNLKEAAERLLEEKFNAKEVYSPATVNESLVLNAALLVNGDCAHLKKESISVIRAFVASGGSRSSKELADVSHILFGKL